MSRLSDLVLRSRESIRALIDGRDCHMKSAVQISAGLLLRDLDFGHTIVFRIHQPFAEDTRAPRGSIQRMKWGNTDAIHAADLCRRAGLDRS
jgi:hypothetical protein